MDFYQRPPRLENQFLSDRLLRSYLELNLPAEVFGALRPELERLGARAAGDLFELAREAEANPPVHVPYDAWGQRVDEIRVSRAWSELERAAAEEGIVASGYERRFGDLSRLCQMAKLYLYHPSSAIYSCPLAMTDGAARVLELHGSAEMKERAYQRLISRDPMSFWTSGQWMTERTGGSDVSGTSTVARPDGEGYRLFGVKWFTSATTSQMAMTLARIEGDPSGKLSLFYVELRDKDGRLQNIQINRLKDKLGTRALPTAELTLTGTPATLVGEPGKGVRTIATLFNITRVYNAVCAVGYMRRGLALATSYAHEREAFGRRLIDHGLHLETLATLQVRFEASFQLTFHTAALLGKDELGTASPVEAGTLRLLIPLTKLFTAKEGVEIASEVLESFGGAGYVEDTGLPELLRNAQVLSIWEGTTNVLSLDVLRAIRKEGAGEACLQDLGQRLGRLTHPELTAERSLLKEALDSLVKDLGRKWDDEDLASSARTLALNLGRSYAAGLMLEHAQKLLLRGDRTGLISAQRWVERGLISGTASAQSRREDSRKLL